jgi:exodeoxyribonuclease VII small subunit
MEKRKAKHNAAPEKPLPLPRPDALMLLFAPELLPGAIMARKPKAVDFEKALAELEQQVHALESGDLPLEEALKAFEAGIKLTRECQQALSEAEQKVQMLLEKNDGSVEYADFPDDSQDD